jgi:hypothetical protein
LPVRFGSREASQMLSMRKADRSRRDRVADQDCEFFTIDIQGTGRPWHILNVIALVDCLDVY